MNVTEPAVVSFKRAQGESYWNFPTIPVEDRHNVWFTAPEKSKLKDELGVIVNPSQQPLHIDAKAMTHWSLNGSWVFSDGFGSGTTLVAALKSGRSAVGTEPDPRQFAAARERLVEEITKLEQETASEVRAEAKAAKAESVAVRKEVSAKVARSQSESRRAKKKKSVLGSPESSKVTHLCSLYSFLGGI
jgi:DNA modification methylase